MTLNQLKIVASLISNDFNLSLTANKLFRVQSALSNQLRLLEEEFGGKLFERRGKRLVKPTPLCDILLPEIERALLAEKNIKTLSLEQKSANKGHLRIATTHTQAKYFLPQVIGEFSTKYPGVQLSIHQGSPAEFLNMLRRHHIDFAIFANEKEVPAEFAKIKCYSWNRVLIVRRNHPLEHEPLSLRKIAEYPIITYMPDFAERHTIEETFSDAGIAIDVSFSAGDTDVIKTYVHLNLGAAIVAQMAQSTPSNTGTDKDLAFRDLSRLFKNSTTRVVYLKELAMREYMREFSDLLQHHGQLFQKQLQINSSKREFPAR